MNSQLKDKMTKIVDGPSWHYGYRAACKDICERFGLENTDEIELLVKDQQLFQAFQGDVNELRDQIAKLERENTRLDIKSCIVDDMSESIDRLKAELAEAKRDAERYQHLKANNTWASWLAINYKPNAWDEKIDAAMQGKDE